MSSPEVSKPEKIDPEDTCREKNLIFIFFYKENEITDI